jgi:phage terminase large subunit-like protein
VKSNLTISSKRANHARGFIESLKHSKGRFAGKPFILADWQWEKMVKPLFGAVRPDGRRQFTTAYWEIPCKNGKSTLLAAIALYCLCADGEQSAEVYGAAADKKQAAIIFKEAVSMIKQSPELMERCHIKYAEKKIEYLPTNSFYEVLAADGFRQEGLNASAIIFDELHTQKKDELYSVLKKRQSAREEPLFIMITTAGWDRESVCWRVHEHAMKIQEGTLDEPHFHAFVISAPEDADWTDEKVWKKYNPALGDFKNLDKMREEYQEALDIPAEQDAYRRYHLNQWRYSKENLFDMTMWVKNKTYVRAENLEGKPCWGLPSV